MLREGSIPLYHQLETIIRKKILSGEYPAGSLVPSEAALAKKYELSRITIRRALDLLEKDDLVVRKRGKGTFVSDKLPALKTSRLDGSIEDLIAMGVKTKIKFIDASFITPPPKVKKLLLTKAGEEVLKVEKLRLVDRKPFSHVVNYLPAAIGKRINLKKIKTEPILLVLEDDLGISVSNAVQTIEATIADIEIAPLLEVQVGDPLMKVERTVYGVNKKPIEFVSVLYRADKYCFTVKLKRKKSSKFNGWSAGK